LSDMTLILLAAGSSSRFSRPVKKQWLRVEHDPLWLFVTNQLTKLHNFKKVIIVTQEEDVAFMRKRLDTLIERQRHNLWWEDAFYGSIDEKPLYIYDVKGIFWAEVDYIEDYERIKKYISSKEDDEQAQ